MGHPPQALLDKPSLLPHLQVYWDAYQRLSRARQWNDGEPQAVTVHDCFAYCDGVGFSSTEAKLQILDLVQELDEVFIEQIKLKRAANAAKLPDSVVVTK